MTIEERLERLTERHEALALSMELASHEWNDRFNKLMTLSNKLLSLSERNTEQIATLMNVALIQERRIQKLEGAEPAA